MIRGLYQKLRKGTAVVAPERDKLLPPRQLVQNIGGGDFRLIGEEFRRYFLELGGLRPDMRMLDVGCGCGRMAVPLLNYFSAEGGYWGFDIMKAGIAWCEQHISAEHPNFHFLLADIYNRSYHRAGQFSAAEYRFPYADEFFDFVSLTSVFTHMLAPEMSNYLGQISRVMKPGGRCLLTFFLWNEESHALLDKGLGTLKFPHREKDCRISQQLHPEAAVAFEEDFVRRACASRGLRIMEPIHYGTWCGRTNHLSYQDLILVSKEAHSRPV